MRIGGPPRTRRGGAPADSGGHGRWPVVRLCRQMCPAIAYHPSIPLRHQIQQVLRSSIEEGSIAPDERLPTELALVQRFGVSRATMRAALAALERDGLIRRRQGSGTFVRPTDALRGAKVEITPPLLRYEGAVARAQ